MYNEQVDVCFWEHLNFAFHTSYDVSHLKTVKFSLPSLTYLQEIASFHFPLIFRVDVKNWWNWMSNYFIQQLQLLTRKSLALEAVVA